MAKIRVYELAKELGKDNKEMENLIRGLGVEIKGVMSTLDDDQAQAVRRALAQRPVRADLSLDVTNATWISGLAAAGLQKMRPAWAPAGAGWAMR